MSIDYTKYEDTVLFLMRHAESTANRNSKIYSLENNLTIPITNPLGIAQSIAAGNFFAPFLEQELGVTDWNELEIHSSHCARVLQTLKGVYNGAAGMNGKPEFTMDARLIEKFFGATNNLANPDSKVGSLEKRFISFLSSLVNEGYSINPFHARNLMGDATAQTYERKVSFLEKVITPSILGGQNKFLLMGHGNGHRCLMASWAEVPVVQMDRIPEPQNADIIMIKGRGPHCTITQIFDGQKMEPVCNNLLETIDYITIDDVTMPPSDLPAKMKPLPHRPTL